MICFAELPSVYKTIILAFILFLNLLQCGYLFMLYRHKSTRLLFVNIILTILVFVSMPILGQSVHSYSRCIKNISVLTIVLSLVFIYIYTIFFIIWEIHKSKEMLTAQSVKESFDNMPAGICFFSENGLPVLCNVQMHRLAYKLLGKDLQMLHEFKAALDTPVNCDVEILQNKGKKVYHFPDGTVWAFSETETSNKTGTRYILLRAINITRLYDLRIELMERNAEINDMIEQVQRVSDNMAEITRQQEILTAKMRVHNKMGNCLLSARQYIVQDFPKEKKTQFLELWKESISALRDEISTEDEPNAYDEVVRIAASIGVKVHIHGDMPLDTNVAYLLVVALRECITNALHHAEANQLDLAITKSNGHIYAVYTNNGKQPEHEITEGGGLTSLRERIEKAGGTMKIQALPYYSLTVIFSENNIKSEEGGF